MYSQILQTVRRGVTGVITPLCHQQHTSLSLVSLKSSIRSFTTDTTSISNKSKYTDSTDNQREYRNNTSAVDKRVNYKKNSVNKQDGARRKQLNEFNDKVKFNIEVYANQLKEKHVIHQKSKSHKVDAELVREFDEAGREVAEFITKNYNINKDSNVRLLSDIIPSLSITTMFHISVWLCNNGIRSVDLVNALLFGFQYKDQINLANKLARHYCDEMPTVLTNYSYQIIFSINSKNPKDKLFFLKKLYERDAKLQEKKEQLQQHVYTPEFMAFMIREFSFNKQELETIKQKAVDLKMIDQAEVQLALIECVMDFQNLTQTYNNLPLESQMGIDGLKSYAMGMIRTKDLVLARSFFDSVLEQKLPIDWVFILNVLKGLKLKPKEILNYQSVIESSYDKLVIAKGKQLRLFFFEALLLSKPKLTKENLLSYFNKLSGKELTVTLFINHIPKFKYNPKLLEESLDDMMELVIKEAPMKLNLESFKLLVWKDVSDLLSAFIHTTKESSPYPFDLLNKVIQCNTIVPMAVYCNIQRFNLATKRWNDFETMRSYNQKFKENTAYYDLNDLSADHIVYQEIIGSDPENLIARFQEFETGATNGTNIRDKMRVPRIHSRIMETYLLLDRVDDAMRWYARYMAFVENNVLMKDYRVYLKFYMYYRIKQDISQMCNWESAMTKDCTKNVVFDANFHSLLTYFQLFLTVPKSNKK